MSSDNPKILIVSTFPVTRAHHGGSKRVRAIVDQYKANFDNVRFVAAFSRFAYPIHALSDIPVSYETDRAIKQNREFEDVICGRAIYDDTRVRERFVKLLKTFRPDIIQIEQVYPYFGLKQVLADMPDYDPTIILSAHNIEAPMKHEIYERLGRGLEIADEIEVLEQELARRAKFVVAVSEEDAAALRTLGAKEVIVAPNGIEPLVVSSRDHDHWTRVFKSKGYDQTFGFVSSAHLPNWHGFLDVVGNSMGFLPHDAAIVLAGSLSDYVEELYKKPKTIAEVTFWKRAYSAGRLTEKRLVGLLSALDVILLPITAGGGSNLKTAEAIISGKKIVATSYAFRAYEEFTNLPNVWIADDPKGFRDNMLAAAKSEYVPRTEAQVESTRAVLWSNTLVPLITKVRAL